MFDVITSHLAEALRNALIATVVPLPFFVILAVAVKGRRVIADVLRAAAECRVNLLMHFTDALLVAPFLIALSLAMEGAFRTYDLALIKPAVWETMHPVAVGFIAVFLGDFIGYWRHRLEHTALFWPTHAVHHSDTAVTWLAVFRIHPINRLTTMLIDFSFLLAMGLPAYAVLTNVLVRHYYGALVHADLPWTYGPLKYVFVSPAMHRWHHAMDPAAYNTNYAQVFSLFDRAFGTFRVPGICTASLGVSEDMGSGIIGQYAHPLKRSSYRYFLRKFRYPIRKNALERTER